MADAAIERVPGSDELGPEQRGGSADPEAVMSGYGDEELGG
jgi:hypothetical protein